MTVSRKPDTQAIIEHIDALKQQEWLGPTRCWWPDYLFRVDDVVATAKILRSGRLFSRAQAIKDGLLVNDAASPIVIDNTSNKWKEYVRLHFRPRTPTQYANEGFRPREACRLGGAHCPAPIVMLFDAKEVLTRSDAQFSDGNLAASSPEIGNDARFLKELPFKKVYHSSSLDEASKSNILYHRQAEVIVPREMDLSALRFIGCRTQAEYETLIYMLTPEARAKWGKHIALGTTRYLHFRLWTFIEQVDMSSESISIKFNPDSYTPGPFVIQVKATDSTKTERRWEKNNYSAKSVQQLALKQKITGGYELVVKLDGRIAYANYYKPSQKPL